MAGRKTPVDQLAKAITKIMEEYNEDVSEEVGKIAEAIGKKGLQALRRNTKNTFPVNGRTKSSGEYAKGWKMDVNRQRLKTTVTIYNDHPGKPHLLEYGHVTRNGTGRTFGKTPAHVHIQPVADELVTAFEREVMAKL